MKRITTQDLNSIVERLNRVTNSPLRPYTKMSGGKIRANPGNYHIDFAYGGHSLHRIQNEKGGITKPIDTGYVSKRVLYQLIHAYMNGILEQWGNCD